MRPIDAVDRKTADRNGSLAWLVVAWLLTFALAEARAGGVSIRCRASG